MRAIADSLWKPGAVQFGRLDIAPDLSWVSVADLVVHDRDGEPAIRAATVAARLDPWRLLRGELVAESVVIEDFRVHLGWDRAGRFSLDGAFRRPGPPRPREPERPPRPEPPVRLDGVELRGGTVVLDWTGWRMRYTDVATRGHIHMGGPSKLVFGAELTTGPAQAHRGSELLAAGLATEIGGFQWRRAGFTAQRVEVTGVGGGRAKVAGSMDFAKEIHASLHGDLRVSAEDAPGAAAFGLPAGIALEGAHVQVTGRRLRGRARRLSAPRVLLGGVQADAVSMRVEGRSSFGGLVSSHRIRSAEVHADVVRISPGYEARGAKLRRVKISWGTTVHASVEGFSAAEVEAPIGALGTVDGEVKLNAGLGGGRFAARLQTPHGSAQTEGDLDVSLVPRRVRVTGQLTMAGLTGPLLRTWTDRMPDALRPLAAAPLEATATWSATVRRRAEAPPHGSRWHVEAQLEEARLAGPSPLVYQAGLWSAVTAAKTEARP